MKFKRWLLGKTFPGQKPSVVHAALHDSVVFGLSNGIWHNMMEQEAMALQTYDG